MSPTASLKGENYVLQTGCVEFNSQVSNSSEFSRRKKRLSKFFSFSKKECENNHCLIL